MRLVSPLNKVLGLGSAKAGGDHWWAQRLSAAALIPLGLWLAWAFVALPDFSHATVAAWIGAPLTTILLLSAVLVLTYHSHLGVQVVVEDYIEGAAKIATLVGSVFAHAFLAVAGIYAILRIGFGA